MTKNKPSTNQKKQPSPYDNRRLKYNEERQKMF